MIKDFIIMMHWNTQRNHVYCQSPYRNGHCQCCSDNGSGRESTIASDFLLALSMLPCDQITFPETNVLLRPLHDLNITCNAKDLMNGNSVKGYEEE